MSDATTRRFDRAEVQAAFDAWRASMDAWDRHVDCFTEDVTWCNSALAQAVTGREAVRAMTKDWPTNLVNSPEWITIDGDRVAFGWNERRGPGGPTIRGMSTLVYAGGGLFSHYEGMFDTAAVVAAYPEYGA